MTNNFSNAALNTRYSRFYVQHFSQAQGRYVSRKPGYPTIEAAQKAAKAADRRKPGFMHFIDVVA